MRRSDQGPPDSQQYYRRVTTRLFSQGDIFSLRKRLRGIRIAEDAPMTYDLLADHIMLTTPTLALRGIGRTAYTNVTLTFIPIRSLRDTPVDDPVSLIDRDDLLDYMYLPADPLSGLPESAAILTSPMTVPRHFLEPDGFLGAKRIAQLNIEGAQQFQKKLFEVVIAGNRQTIDPSEFTPRMD